MANLRTSVTGARVSCSATIRGPFPYPQRQPKGQHTPKNWARCRGSVHLALDVVSRWMRAAISPQIAAHGIGSGWVLRPEVSVRVWDEWVHCPKMPMQYWRCRRGWHNGTMDRVLESAKVLPPDDGSHGCWHGVGFHRSCFCPQEGPTLRWIRDLRPRECCHSRVGACGIGISKAETEPETWFCRKQLLRMTTNAAIQSKNPAIV
jgi:hypothetical protein